MTNNNGAVAEMAAEAVRIEKLMTAVDTTAPHVYTTKSGVALELRPVSTILIRRMQRDTFGRPEVPMVESEIGPKKVKRKEANPADPDYKQALAEWNEDHNERMLIYVLSHGIVDEPQAEDIERLQSFLPGENAAGLKYAWLLEMMSDTEVGELSQLIIGLSVPTETGLSAAEKRFRSDGERQPDTAVQPTED